MMTAKIEGLAELERKMKLLPEKVARNALRAGVNAGAQVIKKEAKRLAPVDTGNLAKRAIYVTRSRREGSRTKEVYKVGVRVGEKEAEKNRDAYYWFMLEYGTEKMAAQPFMRPAFENKKLEAIEAMRKKLAQRIDKANRSL